MEPTGIKANLSVPDISQAREFYTDYLGLSVEEFDMGWVARFRSPDGRAVVQLVTRDATAEPWRCLPVDPDLHRAEETELDTAHDRNLRRLERSRQGPRWVERAGSEPLARLRDRVGTEAWAGHGCEGTAG